MGIHFTRPPKSTNQNSGVCFDAATERGKDTYYGYIMDIWELALLGKGMLVAHQFCLLMAHYWCATGITPLELNSNGALLVRH